MLAPVRACVPSVPRARERRHDVGLGGEKSWRFPRSLAYIAFSLLVALVVFGVVVWLVFGLTLTDLKQASYDSIADAGRLYAEMGLSSASVDAVSEPDA